MNRTALRVAIVALIGAVGLFVLSRLDADTESVESPTIHTGPLGDVGSGLGASRGRRILVNPARDVVVRLMKPTTPVGDAIQVFEPVAEVRGRTVEYLADRKQLFVDPVLVYELPRPDLAADQRRSRFEGVVDHVPAEASADRVLPDDIEKRRPTHLRIQAARAEVTDLDSGQPTVRFLGEPPHGVAITVFVDGGIAAFEGRTDQLTCAIDKRRDRNIIHVTTDRLVRLFSADGRMTFRGEGLAAHVVAPADDGEGTVHVRLARAVRFTWPRAAPPERSARPGQKPRSRRVVAADGWIECDGPATMRIREIATVVDGKPSKASRIEHLSLDGGVRGAIDSIVERRKDDAPDSFDHVQQRFAATRARVSFLEQSVHAIDLDGDFRFVVDHATTPERDATELPNRASLAAERARVAFVDGEPRSIRAYAIGTRQRRTPFAGFGVPPMPMPMHRAPRITGAFELDGVDHGGFEATCRGDVVASIAAIPKDPDDPEHGGTSLVLREVTLHDRPRLELRGLRATRRDGLVPGDSTLTATDTLALRWPDPGTRRIAFDGRGDVRFRSLLGNLSAQHLHGTIHGSRRWRLVADGAPVLDRPVIGRTGGDRVDDVLKTLMLDRGGPEPRAAESAGRLTVRSARAIVESVGVDDEAAGVIRFVGPVRIVQREPATDPITLDCDALRIGFAPGDPDADGKRPTVVEAVATGSVVLDAGRGTRIAGDELVATRTGAAPRARVRGWPARMSAKSDIGDEVVVDGRTIELHPHARRAIVDEGVYARLLPAAARVRGRARERLAVPGSDADYVARLELESERAEIEWAERGGLSSFRAIEAVRIRGFDRRIDDESARLLQWGEADELHHVARDASGGKSHRTTTLIGTREAPVRLAFRDPKVRQAGDHYRLEVPRLVIDDPGDDDGGRSVIGHGAGTLFFLSQDNLFGTKMSGGSRQEERITMRFRNGFTMRELTRDRARVDFPGGGEVRSAGLDGRTNGWLTADDAFAFRIGTTRREEDENARVVESGFAEGNVRFRYLDDTEGACDAMTWERGTNTITVTGDPVRIEHAGSPVRGTTATYDLATGRFEGTRISGTLRRRFDERDRRP